MRGNVSILRPKPRPIMNMLSYRFATLRECTAVFRLEEELRPNGKCVNETASKTNVASSLSPERVKKT